MSVLDEIVARKKADVARRMERVSFDALLERAVPTRRSLADALARPGRRFILECKRASPSEGAMRKDLDIAEMAGVYKDFADAVSILADEPYFGGSLGDVAAAREILDVPILCKDFILGPYQVREARAAGADAVLLMMSVLDDGAYAACAAEAARLSMDALTEAHDESEAKRAIALGARIIGVNNRNLKTLEVDLSVFPRIASMIPGDRIVVCESGISSRDDVRRAERADAFLVGGYIMKSDRPDLAVRRLLFGEVKICGLTSPDAARTAYGAGASFGGLIFADGSPRRVLMNRAREIAGASPLPMAGVFVNESEERVALAANELGLAAVQLHGEESGDFVSRLRTLLPPGCEIWKAVPVGGGHSSATAHGADRVLFDTYRNGARGGTGEAFDWSILRDMADKSRIILAGGISPDNAATAALTGAGMIDANSGVEAPGTPGLKDGARIQKLFDNLRGA